MNKYVGRRQTNEPVLVNLYRWLREGEHLPAWQSRRILDYVDDRFEPKVKR